MIESFKCPSCSAPLEFEGRSMQKCQFCQSNVIVPAQMFQASQTGASGAAASFDLSALTGKALHIAEIQKALRGGNKIYAIKIFRETFGGGLKEAKEAVEAMERGESVDVSGMQIQSAGLPNNAQNLEAVKKLGLTIGGSILATTLIIAFLIIGLIALIFYLVFTTVDKSLDRVLSEKPGVTKNDQSQLAQEEILKFGGEGTGAGRFKDNRSVAVDANGKIYSADYSGGRIQVFDAGGKFLTQWMAGPQMYILDLKVDRQGNIYIAKTNGILVFEGATGKLLQKSENIRAKGLALSLDGKIIAALDQGITIFDGNLKPVQEFKDAAERANATSGFQQIAVDGQGTIYAVDDRNGEICKFSADGKFLNRFKASSSLPNAIAVDNKGRIFVVNTSNILVFDADGRQLNSFPVTQAFGIAFNDADELFVASRPFVVKYKLNF